MALGIKPCPPKGRGSVQQTKVVENMKGKEGGKNAVNNVLSMIKKSGPLPEMAAGTVAGWLSGCIAIRTGKVAACVAGVSIIALQIAHHQGFASQDWKHVPKTMSNAQKKISTSEPVPKVTQTLTQFANTNGYFTAGFVGGFLIGLAS